MRIERYLILHYIIDNRLIIHRIMSIKHTYHLPTKHRHILCHILKVALECPVDLRTEHIAYTHLHSFRHTSQIYPMIDFYS